MCRRRLVASALLALALAACQAILGIEDRPLRPNAETGIPGVEAGPDVAGPCVETTASGCVCPHAFCADFDRTATFDEWVSVVAPAGGALAHSDEDGGATVTVVEAGVSPPNALAARIDQRDDAFVLLTRSLQHVGPSRLEGVHLRYVMRVADLELGNVAGPISDAGVVFSSAIVRPLDTASLRGAMLVVSERGVYVVVSGQNLLEDMKDGGARFAAVLEPINVRDAPFAELELVIAARGRALRERFEACESQPEGTVVAGRIGTSTACVAAPPELASLDWLTEAVVFVGAGTLGAGRAEFRYDNVKVDFLD